jgi:hypothetical protein
MIQGNLVPDLTLGVVGASSTAFDLVSFPFALIDPYNPASIDSCVFPGNKIRRPGRNGSFLFN